MTPAQRKAFFVPPEPPAWCIEMEKWPYDTPEWKQWLADHCRDVAHAQTGLAQTLRVGDGLAG
jgi:hypothetical protein